jgi:hypothetical protein
VHPDVAHAELDALADRGLGVLGASADDHGLHPARHRGEVGPAPVALDLLGVRVDRHDVVAAVAQPPVDDVGAVVLR